MPNQSLVTEVTPHLNQTRVIQTGFQVFLMLIIIMIKLFGCNNHLKICCIYECAFSLNLACKDDGFFYLVNNGVDDQLLQNVFDQSRKFFSLPLVEKMKLGQKEDVGFAPIYAENLESSTASKGVVASVNYHFSSIHMIV